MGFLGQIFQALLSAFCGPNDQQQQQPQQQQYPPQQPQQWGQQPQPVQPHRPHQHQQQPWQPSQDQKPPHQHRPSVSSPPQSPPHKPGKYEDPNQANQHNAWYMDLRARANTEGDQMAQCFSQSHEAYARKDGARAKELSNQGKAHQREMERLNKQASDWIYVENNKDSKPGEIDLHGLYVKEALARTEQAIQAARQRGDTNVHLIVGKGLHSQGHVAKIKPAIEELMRKERLVAEIDPSNAGVLIAHLDGRGRGMNPDEMTRRLERSDESCVIM